METITLYDNYAIGCRSLNADAQPDPSGGVSAACDEAEAKVWTLYGMTDGEEAEAIGEFASRDAVELVYRRIVGEPFVDSNQAGPRLKLMHAAPRLLRACQMVADSWERIDLAGAVSACEEAIASASGPCPPWASAEYDVAALLERSRQIAPIWGIEDMQVARPDLTDKEAWEVLQAAHKHHDAEIGINWSILACHAEMLFGDAPDEFGAG